MCSTEEYKLLSTPEYQDIHILKNTNIHIMANSFIVTLKKSVPEREVKEFIDSVNGVGGQIVHEFSLIKGYTIKMPEKVSLSSFKDKHNNVIESVEEDKEVKIAK